MKKYWISFMVLVTLVFCGMLPIKAVAAEPLIWPVPGHFSLSRGYFSGHKAIDINDSKIKGANIVAACGGTIVRIRKCTVQHYGKDCACGGMGTGVVIKSNGRYYSYAHMLPGSIPSNFKENITKVTAGQFIGKVGTTGNSTGPHLHFCIATGKDFLTGLVDPEKETYTYTQGTPFTFSQNTIKTTATNTDAVIAATLKKPANNKLMSYGATIYNMDGVALGSVSENVNGQSGVTKIDLFWTVSKSIGIKLQPGTTYQYTFWANVSGVKLTSPKYTVKTSGTPSYTVDCYQNYSGKNYFVGSDFKTLDTTRYASRNTSVYTLSVDTSVKHNTKYNTLKIVGTAAGSSSKDLAFALITNGSKDHQYYVGDSSMMTMSFWAKSTVAGAKMYIRWGWQPVAQAKTVELTTEWKYYTVAMPRQALFGNNLHPYFDKAGTFWLSELQMEDGNSATAFAPESGTKTSFTVAHGGKYSTLPTPTRNGYKFLGWYTAATGGEKVTAGEAAKKGNLALYAHWKSTLSVTKQPVSAKVAKGATAKTTVTATGEGLKYSWYVLDPGASKYVKSSITKNAYSFAMTAVKSGRKVYCVVTDKYGQKVQTKTVTLSMAATPKITKQPVSVKVIKGATAKVSFTATGEGLKYTWYVQNPGTTKWVKSSITKSTYSYAMTADKSGRKVYCIVTDKYGQTVKSSTVTLSMATAPKITKQPVSVKAAKGTMAKVTVTATGEGLKYAWYVLNPGASKYVKSSITKSSYSFVMTADKGGRKVYCVVTDKYGQTVKSSVVTMSMK